MRIAKIVALVVGVLLFAAPAFAQLADDYGTTNSNNYCPKISGTMERGARDVAYGGQVSELQKFFSDYYDIDQDEIVTGFFGRITQRYIIQFQKEQGLPSFGIVGSMTRGVIAKVCSQAPSGQTNTQPQKTPTQNTVPANIQTTPTQNTVPANTQTTPNTTNTAPTIYYFNASPTIISGGLPAKLSWSAKASYCYVTRKENNGDFTIVSGKEGSSVTTYSVYPSVTTTYILQCSSPPPGTEKDGPTAMKSVTISVPNPVPTCTLTPHSSTPSLFTNGYDYSVKPNSSVTLTLSSQNAWYAVSNGGKEPTNFSWTENNLTATTNLYSITVHGAGGSATCSSRIYVDYKG